MTGRVRSLSSRSGQASCWPRIAEVPLQGVNPAGAFVSGTRAGVSERLVHDERGGSSFPSEKAFSASRKWCGMTAAGAVAVRLCVARTTAVCWVSVGRGWGHTPVWTWDGADAFIFWPDAVWSGWIKCLFRQEVLSYHWGQRVPEEG